MRIVLDPNVLVSALITQGTPPDRLYQAWLRNEIELVTSTAQIDELADVLSRPKLRRYVDPADAAGLVSDIWLRAIVIRDMPIPRRSPDPKDDAILAAAVAGEAELVVSGDKPGMLALQEVQGIPIRTRAKRCKSRLLRRPPDRPDVSRSASVRRTEAPGARVDSGAIYFRFVSGLHALWAEPRPQRRQRREDLGEMLCMHRHITNHINCAGACRSDGLYIHYMTQIWKHNN